MTLAIPTASSLKLRFPEFRDTEDPVIEFAIEDAVLEFGDGENWTDGASIALTYLAAHYVAAANAANATGGESEIASESIGRLSVSYAKAEPVVRGELGSSSYGQRFDELMRRNFGGPRII